MLIAVFPLPHPHRRCRVGICIACCCKEPKALIVVVLFVQPRLEGRGTHGRFCRHDGVGIDPMMLIAVFPLPHPHRRCRAGICVACREQCGPRCTLRRRPPPRGFAHGVQQVVMPTAAAPLGGRTYPWRHCPRQCRRSAGGGMTMVMRAGRL
jgi:hypothetical protein